VIKLYLRMNKAYLAIRGIRSWPNAHHSCLLTYTHLESHIRAKGYCPTFILAIAGPWLAVCPRRCFPRECDRSTFNRVCGLVVAFLMEVDCSLATRLFGALKSTISALRTYSVLPSCRTRTKCLRPNFTTLRSSVCPGI
jgi:hypothetical protein